MRSLPSKEAQHPLLVPVLLFAVILAVYYPAMLSGIHSIDDPGITSFYTGSPPLSQILLPGSYYYRPLIELSFWLDNLLWGMEPAVMHLENILLHVANTVLVFLLARRIAGKYGVATPWIPLCTALLFALHPLNVEAVAWIAGRTDPMLGVFALSACWFLLKWLDEPRWLSALCVLLFFTLAMLTKETAIAFLPVAMLIVWSWPAAAGALPYRQRVKLIAVTATSTLVFALLAFILQGKLMAVGRFLGGGDRTPLQLIGDAVTALGFYLGKAFAPLPLNFAITEVSPAYALLAVAALLALPVALKHRLLPALFFAAALLLITPALVVAVWNISWTPYAERYMYLPTAFVSLGIGTVLYSRQQKFLVTLAPLLILLLLLAAVASRQRVALWQDKIAFYQDALAKSPGFGSLYNELGMLFMQQNQFDRAAEAFATAERLNKRPSMINLIRANVMGAMVAKGELAAAKRYFHSHYPAKTDAPVVFLEMLQRTDGKIRDTLPPEGRVDLSRDLMETFAVLYEKTKDPFWLYRSGQLARELKSYPQALALFRQAYAEAPADATYRLAAGKQVAGLQGMK